MNRIGQIGVGEHGGVTFHVLVLMVPVFFGLMGFGIDLGRLYLVRGELTQAAEAMAQTAAHQLIGTDRSLDNAQFAAQLNVENAAGFGNKFNFGSVLVGGSTALLTSEIQAPGFFSTSTAALESDPSSSGDASGADARFVRISLRADAPLLFWSVLSLGQERKTPIAATALAGVSAPVCQACGVEPFTIAALSQEDPVDFGFVRATKYTFNFVCNGQPQPQLLGGTTQRIPYLLLNKYNDQSVVAEDQQLYRAGAAGLLPSTNPAFSCVRIGAEETSWVSAAPQPCAMGRPANSVIASLCGMASRFDTVMPDTCSFVTDVDTLATSYQADTDASDIDDYPVYTGNARRLITVPVVDALTSSGPMVVLGFRQFLVEPNQNDVTITPGDTGGRFSALYIGYPAPLKQGRLDGCQVVSGPGKVVLHQ
jgi:Flp pilus assembly protein TadG